MSIPKTRIPKALRGDVRAAFECFRDYLEAIGNHAGATMVCDLTEVLGLEPLVPKHPSRYSNVTVSWLLKDRRKYGAR